MGHDESRVRFRFSESQKINLFDPHTCQGMRSQGMRRYGIAPMKIQAIGGVPASNITKSCSGGESPDESRTSL